MLNYINDSPVPRVPYGCSEEFQDFITVCLGKTSGTRSNVGELLNHPFVQMNTNAMDYSLWLESIPPL